jgi:hypothetical protein
MQAELAVCIFFLFLCSLYLLIWNFRVRFCAHEGTVPYRSLAHMNFLSGGGRCFIYCARHFRTAKSTPLIAISRNLAPFDNVTWKVITQKCLFFSFFFFNDSRRSELG